MGSKLKRFSLCRTRRRTRGRARVWLSTFTLVVLVLAMTMQGAVAGRVWCRTDPLLLIDGKLVDISVSGPLTAPLLVTGPTRIELLVPVGVDAQVLISDLGFGRGYETTVREVKSLSKTKRYTEIRVRAYVPAKDSSMPVLLETAPGLLSLLRPVQAEGTANSWVTMTVKVPR